MEKAPEEYRFAVVAIDVVVFTVIDGNLNVLLTKVDRPPYYTDIEAVPGGIITAEETAEDAVSRHLKEKVGITSLYTEQLYTFSELDRDPRGRVVAVAHVGLMSSDQVLKATINDARWCPMRKLPKLAFDHTSIVGMALDRVKAKLEYTNIAQFLLNKEFTLTELQEVYELVLEKEFDKRNFRKKVLALGLVEETGKRQEGVKNRPALLYRFVDKKLTVLDLIT